MTANGVELLLAVDLRPWLDDPSVESWTSTYFTHHIQWVSMIASMIATGVFSTDQVPFGFPSVDFATEMVWYTVLPVFLGLSVLNMRKKNRNPKNYE